MVSLVARMTATYNTDPDPAILNQAIAAAAMARERAYAPYSRFLVGAALIDRQGGIHVGCNVENASYGLTQCAERSAVTAATATGQREIIACVVITDTVEPTMPCGACRQVLAEFGTDLLIVSRTLSGAELRTTLYELLPHAFGPRQLPGDPSA